MSTLRMARAAIEAILAAIPDEDLPEFDKVEERDGRVIAWYGSTGHHLGTARTTGERDLLAYRRSAAWQAIENEMACRADAKFLANGDSLGGAS